MKDKIEFFQQSTPFLKLTVDEMEPIMNLVEAAKFEADEIIIRQGHKGDGLYLIKSGSVSVTLREPGDKLVNLGILREYDEFGVVNLLERSVTYTTVKALEKTHCYFLSSNYFEMLRFGNPVLGAKVNHAITEKVCQRLRVTNDKILKCLSGDPNSHKSKKWTGKIIAARQKTKKSEDKLGKNINYISQIGFFQHFSRREIETLLTYLNLCEAKQKTLIIRKGEEAFACYIPIRGCARIILDHEDVVSMLNVQGPGGLFGHTAFILKHQRLFSCVAYEDCILFELTQKSWGKLKNDNIYLWYKTFDVICKSLLREMRFSKMQLVRVETELQER